MPNRRYHIHVICAANDQLIVLDRIAMFFQSQAFLTYDVSSRLPQAALYGRQCVEACDYTVMVIGESYGAPHNTGVSQMHLSYLSARAKLKPMLTLIKTHNADAISARPLQEFTRSVEKQASYIYYYDESTDIAQLLAEAYKELNAKHPAFGWIRAKAAIDIPIASVPTSFATRPPTTIGNQGNTTPSSVKTNFDSITEALVLTDNFEFQYSAQAYEGGNLKDVDMSLSCSWQEILQALVKIPSAFSSYGLQSCINRLIAAKAEHDIKQLMPNVHAVSRCQIAKSDLVKLQRSLVAANWMELTAAGVRSSQELWKLTFYAKKTFENNLPKSNQK